MNKQLSKQEQADILNKVYIALGQLKIDGTQSEILSEVRKAVSIVNNTLVAEFQMESLIAAKQNEPQVNGELEAIA